MGQFAQPAAESAMGTRIYVGNLSTRVTESDLEDEFKKYGCVRNIWVARQPPGFAFVVMEDDRDAVDAIHEMDGLHGWRVEFSRKDMQRRPERGGGPHKNAREPFRCYECGEPGHLARDCRVRHSRLGRPERSRSREWRHSRDSYDRSREGSFGPGRSSSRERYRNKDGSERRQEMRSRERSRDRSFSRGSFDRPREEPAPEKRASASPAPRG